MNAKRSFGHRFYVDASLATVVAVVAAAITLPFGESVIGVQLAAIGRQFDATGSALQWVVNAYMLTFATSILIMGVAADRLGRRRLFALGLVLVGLANATAIFAPSLGSLIGLRAIAGFGAGTLLASGPALLAARFPTHGLARARAFAAFGSAAGSGIAFGPLVGGLIMDWAGWRAVFAVYLPFILIAAVLLPRIAPSRNADAPPIDVMGMGLFTIALAALVWLIQGRVGESAPRWMIVIVVLVSLVALVVVERRRRYPAIDPALFANPIFRVMSLTMVCWQIGVAVSMVYVPAVAVAGLHASPGFAGASILPMAILLFVATPLGPWCVDRIGINGFIVFCIGTMSLGETLIWATLNAPTPWPIVGLVGGLTLIGLGGGAANGSMDNLAMGTISSARAGLAAGLFQTVRIGSAALAIAAAGRLLSISDTSTASTMSDGVIDRYATLAGSGALAMVAMALVALVWLGMAATGSTRIDTRR